MTIMVNIACRYLVPANCRGQRDRLGLLLRMMPRQTVAQWAANKLHIPVHFLLSATGPA